MSAARVPAPWLTIRHNSPAGPGILLRSFIFGRYPAPRFEWTGRALGGAAGGLRRLSARILALAAATWLAASSGAAAEPVRLFVLREHGVTAVALAQPYLDRFVALAAAQNGWTSAQGVYLTSREAAEAFIRSDHPHYAILSLPAFLAMRGPERLEVIGRVEVSLSGGRRYHLISRSAADLQGCRGQTLATDHARDTRFLERVVAGRQFALGDFQVRATRRPLQTTREVLDGKAVCALIDDAQLAELDHLPEADGVRAVWSSDELPQMVVAALPAAPAAEKRAFQANLTRLCAEEGKAICAEVGIVSLAGSGAAEYAAMVAAYGD